MLDCTLELASDYPVDGDGWRSMDLPEGRRTVGVLWYACLIIKCECGWCFAGWPVCAQGRLVGRLVG